MKKKIIYLLCTLLSGLILTGNSYAGKLDDFENDIKKASPAVKEQTKKGSLMGSDQVK